jgi:hypothetical protein
MAEIRQILLGHFMTVHGGEIGVRPGINLLNTGVYDGAENVVFFGVGHTGKHYVSDKNDSPDKQLYRVEKTLEEMGRSLIMESARDKPAFLCSFYLTRPAVVMADVIDNMLYVDAYSGRSIGGFLSRQRCIRRIEKEAMLIVDKTEKDPMKGPFKKLRRNLAAKKAAKQSEKKEEEEIKEEE